MCRVCHIIANVRERCNGQYESYWRWQQDEATNTWVLNAILPSANCMTANGAPHFVQRCALLTG